MGARFNKPMTKPPWVAHKASSRAADAIGWIQRWIIVPSGRNAGKPLKLAKFQTDIIEALLAEGETSGGFSIPAGNAKSTLAAALGLWALAAHDDAPQVALIATNGAQAVRTLYTPARQMVNANDELGVHIQIRKDNIQRGFEGWWNGGAAWVLPASDDRLQGLNPTLALIDEAEFVEVDVLQALEDRLGKREEQLVLTFGTPGPDMDCALWHVRSMAEGGGGYRFVEHAAPDGAKLDDPRVWKKANPGIGAGLLGIDAIERAWANVEHAPEHKRLMMTNRFRTFRLGQWLNAASLESWLPAGAWDGCRTLPPPGDRARIVLAVDGTYRRSTAVVGCDIETLAVFVVFAGEGVTDDELEAVIDESCDRWSVEEIAHYPSLRAALFGRLDRRGLQLHEMALTRAEETKATNELWNSIVEGSFVHDGNPTLAEHMANVAYRETPSGVMLKRGVDDGQWIDAAMSARMAWWRAQPSNFGSLDLF